MIPPFCRLTNPNTMDAYDDDRLIFAFLSSIPLLSKHVRETFIDNKTFNLILVVQVLWELASVSNRKEITNDRPNAFTLN